MRKPEDSVCVCVCVCERGKGKLGDYLCACMTG